MTMAGGEGEHIGRLEPGCRRQRIELRDRHAYPPPPAEVECGPYSGRDG